MTASGWKYNTAAPGYSKFLASQLNLKGAFDQYGFYGAVVGGTAYLASRFYQGTRAQVPVPEGPA